MSGGTGLMIAGQMHACVTGLSRLCNQQYFTLTMDLTLGGKLEQMNLDVPLLL
jgi:hypothetical protein